MGAGFSGFSSDKIEEGTSSPFQPALGGVPESCVSLILMNLDPPEICKLARLNRTFHGASLADFVWETKLPSNYKFIIKKVLQESLETFTKKDIYARLCQPNFFDAATRVVWLDKYSGKTCLSISYKALRITGIDDRRYWSHVSSEESRFKTVAYLQQTWWLEVVGDIEFEFPRGNYSLFFRLQLGKSAKSKRSNRRICHTNQVHGWDIKPVRFQMWTSDGQQASSECYLKERGGGWIHYHVGEFTVDHNFNSSNSNSNNTPTMKIKFSMMQIDCTHTKGGLCLDSVLICPTEISGNFTQI